MKKALVIILAIITILVVAVSLIIFVPKIANEAKINKLSAGGVKLGETTFSLNDAFEGTVNITEDNKIEFCFTEVYGQTDFVKEKRNLHFIGEYSVGLDKNITIDVEEYYETLELVGTEENIENYIITHTNRFQLYLDKGNYTKEQYDREISLINGEKCYPTKDATLITTVKLRMDTENNNVYLISYGNNYNTIEFSYYDTGEIKSQKHKGLGVIPLYLVEYDTKGNQLIENSEREFYDNGVIKKESVKQDYELHIYEYDTNGRLIKHLFGDRIIETYEYNAEGICICVKQDWFYGGSYVRQIKGYEHELRINYDNTGTATSASEYLCEIHIKEIGYNNGKLYYERYYNESEKITYECFYNEAGSLSLERYYDENGEPTETIAYDDNGEISKKYIFNENVTREIYYYINGKLSSIEYYDENGDLINREHYNEKGELNYTDIY